MAQEAGFKIGDDFYPVPDHFTLGDAVLVKEVAGLEWEEFAAQLDGDGGTSARTLIGLVAVAVAHGEPRWSRDRVLSFVGAVDLRTFEQVEGDEHPPATPAEKSSRARSAESTPTAEVPA